MMIGPLLFLVSVEASIPDSPIIGIVAQPYKTDQQYIAASYVKFIEMGGGRAVPLSYIASNQTTLSWLKQLNGVLLPGGGSDLPDAARLAIQYGMDMWAQGEVFPVWGTCLGFEWVTMAVGNVATEDHPANNISLTLNITGTGYVLDGLEFLADEALAMNNHNYGFSPETFKKGGLQIFDVLSTCLDENGQSFVSTIEAKGGLPLYGVQWHPEKNAFETGMTPAGYPFEAINHSTRAVAVTAALSSKLCDKARLSTQKFQSPLNESASLFSNCVPSTECAPEFVQAYFFPGDWDGELSPC